MIDYYIITELAPICGESVEMSQKIDYCLQKIPPHSSSILSDRDPTITWPHLVNQSRTSRLVLLVNSGRETQNDTPNE
jgi:hypothetical protein